MSLVLRLAVLALLGVLLQAVALAASPPAPPKLTSPPLGERWFSINLNGERTGFFSMKIEPVADGYEVTAAGSVKMVVLGFTRQASAREYYRVGKDLALRSFAVEQAIDRSPKKVSGTVTEKGVKVAVESGGSRTEKLLKAKGPVYPPPLLNLVPLRQGLPAGKSLKVQMLDFEGVAVKEVKITLQGVETLAGGQTVVHLRNDLYPFVDNDIWLDLAGNVVKESVRDGLIDTLAEDAATAGRFLLESSLARKDLILDFSLVRLAQPIERPTELQELQVEFAGIPAAFPLPVGPGQQVQRNAEGKVLVTLRPTLPGVPAEPASAAELAPFLVATERILPDNPEIAARAREILAGESEPLAQVQRLVRWVADYVEDTVTDSQSPLEVLQLRKGNCQSHARLYASLARAAGIPTRFVSGLVYQPGQGFLYHSWAESYAGRWVMVDPTFGQVPADATHVTLVVGDGPDEMAPIAGVIGRLSATVVQTRY